MSGCPKTNYVKKSFQNLVANRPPVAKPSISDTDQVSGIFKQVLELPAHKLLSFVQMLVF